MSSPFPKHFHRITISIFIALVVCSTNCEAQIYIGISSGTYNIGEQDQKFKHYSADGALKRMIVVNDIDHNISPIYSLYGGFWLKNNLGVQIEYAAWEFTSFVEDPEEFDLPVSSIVDQGREKIYFNILYRFSEVFNKLSPVVGIGGGPVQSDIDPGRFEWKPGIQLLAELNYPISDHISLSAEFKHVMVHDVDNTKADNKDWVVDTSGSPTLFRLDKHLDTRFTTLQIGIRYSIN